MPSAPVPPPPERERLERLLERTTRLHNVTAHLSSALTVEHVAAIVVDEGATALGAHSGALWRVDESSQQLVMVRSREYSAAALAAVSRMKIVPEVPICDAVLRAQPVWLSSHADYMARYPESATRTASLRSSGYSVAALPVVIDGKARGVFALTFLFERGFDEDERMYLQFLALHCAQGFERARLYGESELAKERAQFLSRASGVLASSLDYEQTLQNVANLAVPRIGEWCGVDLLDEAGKLRLVAVGHVDPAKVTLARELRDRYPPDPAVPAGLWNVIKTGVSELYPDVTDEMLAAGAQDAEHLRISKELQLRSVIIVPVRDAERVVGAITFVATTPRYTADDLLMAEQLGERAGAAITNARLYAAARDAIRVRDEFMLVAGHELRTPIAAMSLHHEALIATKDDTPLDKIRARAVKLHAQTDRLIRLVEELLDVSRLSAGRLTLEPESFDLDVLVRDIVDRMHDDFERAQCTVTVTGESVGGTWDRARIDQVVTNLITNALKYGRGAPIEITVARDGDRALLQVTDHGIGIAPADQPRIFKRFERAVSARNFGGLGLGLWIASQLVEAHAGTIGVTSDLGQGATFTVTLPATP